MPPRSVEILGRSDGEEVVVAADDSLTLDCVVRDARPAPTATWYRDGVPLPQGECLSLGLPAGHVVFHLISEVVQ